MKRTANGLTSLGWVLGLVGIGALLGGAVPDSDSSQQGPLLVTSSLGVQSAILFVIDPESQVLTSYEATPGATGGLRLLGARKIEHDLRLTRYRDQSEFSYSELRKRYEAGEEDSIDKVDRDEQP